MGNTVVLLTPLSFWMICLRFDSPFTTIDFHSREKDTPIARIASSCAMAPLSTVHRKVVSEAFLNLA